MARPPWSAIAHAGIVTGSADRFLAAKLRRARLIFGLDATASRQPMWDLACRLTANMFREVANVGSLETQLVFYRGMSGFDGECKASPWIAPTHLTAYMEGIQCRAGATQIGKVPTHVINESQQQPVNALIYVGDAMEENANTLISRAGLMNVPAFMFQELNGELHSSGQKYVEEVYRAIAKASHGAYCHFNEGAAHQLGDLLRAVLAFVVGGIAALEAKKDEASIKL